MTDVMPDGRWDGWYDHIKMIQPYGDTQTYDIGAAFLSDCATVEDWGCGLGWFHTLRPDGYIGVDGSHTPHADVYADLCDYRSTVPGIFMRHVLEHNHDWARVLDNAVASFTERMALILFTPLVETTVQIATTTIGENQIPDYAFALPDLVGRFRQDDVITTRLNLSSPETQYGVEHVLLVERGHCDD